MGADGGAAALFQATMFEHQQVLESTPAALGDDFKALANACVDALKSGRKLLLFGNGGSAGDAQHIATELVVRYRRDRPAIAAIALTTDTSALTAIGNDLGFEELFARQIEALATVGDVALGISTSGNSPNVLKGLAAARKRGCVTAGLAGNDGGKMKDLCVPLLIVPSRTTARIQEMHIVIGHVLCEAIEAGLGHG
jgi:D-sedoheptulose 7-phosphate isomerase